MADIQYTEAGVLFGGQLVSWEDLEAQRNQFRFMRSVLVKISFTYGRQDFQDAEIYDAAEWHKLRETVRGLNVFFSDFAGKHSEVSLDLFKTVELEEITNLDEIIEFHRVYGFVNHDLGIIEAALEQGRENGDIDHDGNRVSEEDPSE